MSREYRIVHDEYLGFEVQHRTWWWPFWRETGFSNTHLTIERAEAFALADSRKEVKRLGKLS